MSNIKNYYSYSEFCELDPHVKDWAQKIAKSDYRLCHPEDYVIWANKLIEKAKINGKIDCVEERRLFAMILTLYNNKECHCDSCYSFLDWFGYIVG